MELISQNSTISYISGGLLGDSIHQLSIIKENYIKTGKKGILYITNYVGDPFSLGLERAYNDTFPFVSKQSYIHEYKIYNGEPYDINLSSWRENSLLFNVNWPTLFRNEYNVEWGTNRWIEEGTIAIKPHFKDIIFISIGLRRYPSINFNTLLEKYKDETVIFITQVINEYHTFKSKSGIELPVYIPHTFEDLVSSIASCKLFIGSTSSPLTVAHSLHKNNIILANPSSLELALFSDIDKVIQSCQFYKDD